MYVKENFLTLQNHSQQICEYSLADRAIYSQRMDVTIKHKPYTFFKLGRLNKAITLKKLLSLENTYPIVVIFLRSFLFLAQGASNVCTRCRHDNKENGLRVLAASLRVIFAMAGNVP